MRTITIALLLVAARAAAQPAPDPHPPAPPAPPTPPAPAPAPPAPAPAPPAPAPAPPTSAVTGKWTTQLYGFVELDAISDSTQGLNDLAGNSGIARPNTYTGDHGQLTFTGRNSRIGLKLGAP